MSVAELFEDAVYAGKRRSFAVLLMLAVPVLMTVFAAPLTEVSQHAAVTLHNTQVAVDTVFALAKGQ